MVAFGWREPSRHALSERFDQGEYEEIQLGLSDDPQHVVEMSRFTDPTQEGQFVVSGIFNDKRRGQVRRIVRINPGDDTEFDRLMKAVDQAHEACADALSEALHL